MKFSIGPYRYSLLVSVDPPEHQGREVMALCCEAEREIRLSPKVPRRNRMALLGHELAHAWAFAVGEPATLEGWCDLSGMALASAVRDLSYQGGEAALMALEPGESLSPKTISLTQSRCCAVCGGTVAGGSVVWGPGDHPGVLDVALYCPSCEHIQRWGEAAGANGFPSGVVVRSAMFERGEAVAEFLRRNPMAACEGAC